MKLLRFATALLACSLVASIFSTQPVVSQNPTCPTRPLGDKTNACASTAFVANAIAVAAGVAGSDTQVQFNNKGAFGASPNFTWVSPAVTIGVAGSATGQLKLTGATSGTVTITPQATAGTPTITLPTASGTVAVSATSPLALSATTGALTCTGCLTNTPAALTKTDDTNVTLTLGGTPSTALLQATSITVGWTGQLALTRGGTGKALTADNGGVVYTDTDSMEVLAAVATASRPLLSGANTAPTWATISFPTSANSGGIPFFQSASVMASSAALTQFGPVYGGGAGAAPVSMAAGTDGQLIVGQTSAAPLWRTIGTDATISAAGALTISTNVVSDTKFRQSAALSVVGRSSNSTGNVADIAAASDGDVLRRSGTTLGFGAVASAGLATDSVTTIKVATSARAFSDVMVNGTLTGTVGSNALTVSIKTSSGSDPSSTDPVDIFFRNATAGTGDYTRIRLTSSTSFVISSGSTVGFPSASFARIWIIGFNDAGTFRLGVFNARASATQICPLDEYNVKSSTAEGGAGGADSACVFYTGTAVSSKAFRILGYMDFSLTTAGTWDEVPDRIQLFGPGIPRPGNVVQQVRNLTGAVATGTTTIPGDNTTPQNTEGTEFITQAITPTAAANVLQIDSQMDLVASAAVLIIAALFQDTTADALGTSYIHGTGTNDGTMLPMGHMMIAGTTSSTTFKIRAGGSGASTITFNGHGGSGLFNGTIRSFLQIMEIMG